MSVTQQDIQCVVCREIPSTFYVMCNNLHVMCESCVAGYNDAVRKATGYAPTKCPLRCRSNICQHTNPSPLAINITNVVLKLASNVEVKCENCNWTGPLSQYNKTHQSKFWVQHASAWSSAAKVPAMRYPFTAACTKKCALEKMKAHCGVNFRKFSTMTWRVSGSLYYLRNLIQKSTGKKIVLIMRTNGPSGDIMNWEPDHQYIHSLTYQAFLLDYPENCETAPTAHIQLLCNPLKSIRLKIHLSDYYSCMPQTLFVPTTSEANVTSIHRLGSSWQGKMKTISQLEKLFPVTSGCRVKVTID